MTETTPFDPTKPCCLRADLDKPADRRRTVRILATDARLRPLIVEFEDGYICSFMADGRQCKGGDGFGDLVNIPPAPAQRCEPPRELMGKAHHYLSNKNSTDPILWRWTGDNWAQTGSVFFTPESMYAESWRYWGPTVPGPRYGEADPRDAEIERLKDEVAALFDDVAAKAEIIDRLDARLSDARKPIEVTEKMVEVAKKKWETCYLRDYQSALRDIIEAALAAREW